MTKLEATGISGTFEIVVEGESAHATDPTADRLVKATMAEYGPDCGDPELWLAGEMVRLMGARITESHEPEPERTSYEGRPEDASQDDSPEARA
jgi:hypothetical protein